MAAATTTVLQDVHSALERAVAARYGPTWDDDDIVAVPDLHTHRVCLHLATRVVDRCNSCGAPLVTGAVGLSYSCVGEEVYEQDWMHDCGGGWNAPLQVTTTASSDDLDQLAADGLTADDIAQRLLERALTELERLVQVTQHARAAQQARDDRDDAIRAAAAEGHSLRTIGRAAGLSHTAVANIIQRA